MYANSDVYNAALQGQLANNNLEAEKRRTQVGQDARNFAQQYALQGLQNQIAAQNHANTLAQLRSDNAYGAAGNLLRGLFS